jgi:hypothetical protein
MMIRIEYTHGCPSRVPSIMKHAMRFCRRMRARGILDVECPAMVDTDAASITIRVGCRIAIIHKDGDVRPSCRPASVWLTGRVVHDPHAMRAHFNRTHAMWLTFAHEDRRCGWINLVRGHIATARGDRMILEELDHHAQNPNANDTTGATHDH